MKLNRLIIIVSALLGIIHNASSQPQLVTYPAPPKEPNS